MFTKCLLNENKNKISCYLKKDLILAPLYGTYVPYYAAEQVGFTPCFKSFVCLP